MKLYKGFDASSLTNWVGPQPRTYMHKLLSAATSDKHLMAELVKDPQFKICSVCGANYTSTQKKTYKDKTYFYARWYHYGKYGFKCHKCHCREREQYRIYKHRKGYILKAVDIIQQ